MARGEPTQSNTSLMYFFAALGLLLFVSTMLPSCHSRQSQWTVWSAPAHTNGYAHYSPPPPTPPPSGSHTSPTPPAKPATPPPPPPPHH